jgi:anti-sigma factor RsiW
MSCSDYEQLIALYVEEDLSASERGRVAAHIQECSDCWDLAEDLKESQAVFKSMRQDVPDTTALSVLRERVLSEAVDRAPMAWFERFLFGGLRRKVALAGVALVVLGSGLLWTARSPRVETVTPPVVTGERAPSVVVPIPVSDPQPVPAAPRRAPKRERRIAPPQVEETRQVAIQFVTDDPNVIIYWLVDEKGD